MRSLLDSPDRARDIREMLRRRAVCLLAVALPVFSSRGANALDCAHPMKGTEQVVCITPELRRLDRLLEGYFMEMKAVSAKDPTRRAAAIVMQREWTEAMFVRDGRPATAAEIMHAYKYRIVQLRSWLGELQVADVAEAEIRRDATLSYHWVRRMFDGEVALRFPQVTHAKSDEDAKTINRAVLELVDQATANLLQCDAGVGARGEAPYTFDVAKAAVDLFEVTFTDLWRATSCNADRPLRGKTTLVWDLRTGEAFRHERLAGYEPKEVDEGDPVFTRILSVKPGAEAQLTAKVTQLPEWSQKIDHLSPDCNATLPASLDISPPLFDARTNSVLFFRSGEPPFATCPIAVRVPIGAVAPLLATDPNTADIVKRYVAAGWMDRKVGDAVTAMARSLRER